MIDDTHSPDLRSWVESANGGATDFPIQNLPFGVFRCAGSADPFRGGVAIGECVLDMAAAYATGLFGGAAALAAKACGEASLNALMALPRTPLAALRARLSTLLQAGAPEQAALSACLLPMRDAELAMPAAVGDYTDFLSSTHHMENMGRIFAPGQPLPPNFRWHPPAYHGRASTLDVSGAPLRRPLGQTRVPGQERPSFGPSAKLDYELELGAFIGPGTARGQSLSVEEADARIFGLVLLNDWSARDIQGWESNPLGPFLGKNFLTTISPWVVTAEALRPFRCVAEGASQDPETLANLRPGSIDHPGTYDLHLEVELTPAAGRPTVLARTNFRHAHWTLAQMLARHTEGGCRMRSGDLIGTGTQSGAGRGEEGCLMEASRNGTEPVPLAGGGERSFLEDGDTVVLRGWCEGPGRARIGFGECRGTLV